jgi:hypothetical protein
MEVLILSLRTITFQEWRDTRTLTSTSLLICFEHRPARMTTRKSDNSDFSI